MLEDSTQPNAIARTATPTMPPAPPPETPTVSRAKVWEWVKDLSTIALVPLGLWVINLSVGNALRDERIGHLQAEITALHEQQKEIDGVKKDLQDVSLQMVRLDGKIDLANGRLDEIKSLLR